MPLRVLAAEPNIGMTVGEIREFLGHGTLLLKLGTIDAKGDPNVHPVWYVYDRDSGKLYFATGKRSMKAENLKRRHRAYFCVDDDKPPQKGVRGKAVARFLENREQIFGLAERLVLKYMGTAEGPIARGFLDHIRTGDFLVELSPEYLSTWDYAKMKM
jgi:pyridoxamine 5'-phosphate oxidase-like protein